MVIHRKNSFIFGGNLFIAYVIGNLWIRLRMVKKTYHSFHIILPVNRANVTIANSQAWITWTGDKNSMFLTLFNEMYWDYAAKFHLSFFEYICIFHNPYKYVIYIVICLDMYMFRIRICLVIHIFLWNLCRTSLSGALTVC